MSPYYDVYLTVFQTFLYILYFPCSTQTAHIIHRTGKSFQPGSESIEMLQGEDRGRDKHGHLLAVRHGLERCPDGNFSLAESYIPANETVHRTGILHILLDGDSSQFLIGSILIHEG